MSLVRAFMAWLRRRIDPSTLETTFVPRRDPSVVSARSTARQEERVAVRRTMAHEIDVAHRSVTMRLANRPRPASRPKGAPD